jgi:hypothetical protein
MPCSLENISEEYIAYIFRVKVQAKQETSRSRWQATGFLLGLLLKLEDRGNIFL